MYSIIRTILQRLGLGLLTLVGVSVIIFASVEFLPGGYAENVLGQAATEETVANFKRELGLDRPATTRYFEWIDGVIVGDFGTAYTGMGGTTRRNVTDIIAPRLYNTLLLAAMAAIVGIPIAMVLGLLAALHRNSVFDRVTNTAALAITAMPEFLIAYVLMLIFAIKLRWLPSLSTMNYDLPLYDQLSRLILPALTLALVILAYMFRMTRASILSLLGSRYIEMAQLKGISPRKVILRHALPNAWAPIATVIAFNLAYLVVGVVVVETVFVYPGVGHLMVDAVSSRDMPVVQACAMIFAATYIVLNLFADIIGIVTNPRLLHPN